MNIFFIVQLFADWLTYTVFKIIPNTLLGNAVNFFIFDIIKIGLLLIVINYIMATIRYFFSMEKARDILVAKRWFGINYLIAALLGVITPFCSCSSIPLFIGFMSAGIPLGITFAFLISSPLINESSLYLFPAMFGLKVTILYNIFGIVIAILGGIIIQKLKLDKYILPELLKFKSRKQVELDNGGNKLNFWQLAVYLWKDGLVITKQIFPYVMLGIGVGAIIHGYIPSYLVETYLSAKTWWTVPAAVLLGAPIYANSVSVLPIMEAMVNKGAPLGTVLAFMTAIVTISLPEILILKKIMKWQLLAIFFGIIITGVIIMGYLFNIIL